LEEEITIRAAVTKDLPSVENLLTLSGLPAEDCEQHLSNFFIAEIHNQHIGVGGLQICGDAGLVRSLAIAPAYRDKGVGKDIYARILERARKIGVKDLYLLTDTASTYFGKLGYEVIDRADTPDTIAATRQFTELCPQSAVVMYQCIRTV